VDRHVINIGSGAETSINELVRLIGAAVGRDPHLLYAGGQSGGVSRMCADLTLAHDRLGYKPQVFLEEGLRRVVAEDERFAARMTPHHG
jgi:nucleoside-diphosphate-sugar epimerase